MAVLVHPSSATDPATAAPASTSPAPTNQGTTGPMATALSVEGVTVRFGEQTVLDNVSFQVPPGQVVGLLGSNGAGKSTAIRVALGHLRPMQGQATIFGRSVRDYPVPLLHVGAMTDSVGLEPSLSGRQLLRVLAGGAGIDRRRVEDVLQRAGAEGYADKVIRKLSTGMRQRVALAVALIGDPQLLILDEPINGLDPDGVRWFRGFLRQWAAEGRSALLSSHLLGEVEQSVDRLVLLRHRVLFDGTLHELPVPGRLEDSYFALTDGSARGASAAGASAAGVVGR